MPDANHFGETAGIKEAFTILLNEESYGPFVQAVVEAFAKQGQLDQQAWQALQQAHGVTNPGVYKLVFMDVILAYIQLALDDHILNTAEVDTVSYLKRLFGIQEGDFHQFRHAQVGKVLHRQFERIYRDDDRVSLEEAMQKVALQDVFDLSYDQFLAFKELEIRLALARGAKIRDLDTAWIPKNKGGL